MMNGYQCPVCGVWVSYNTYHLCTGKQNINPVQWAGSGLDLNSSKLDRIIELLEEIAKK